MTMTAKEKKEFDAQLARAMELSDEYFECRSKRHTWIDVQPFIDPPLGEPLCWYCTSCTMFRVYIVSKKYGEILSKYYIPPKDYYITKPEDGTRAFSAAALRVARIRRMKGRELPAIVPTRGGEG